MSGPCIKSTYYKDRNGYALLRYNGKLEYHHRVAFAEANSLTMQDIEGKYILHSCDNPACVNPKHLRIGTPADNTADMMSRGRCGWKSQLGETNAASRLTKELVLEIRASPLTQVELAKKYGVTQANISSIILRKTWKHI
jgi:hypothetical protein